MTAIPSLAIHDLSIGYRKGRGLARVIGSHISLALHPGELVCLLGPNGVGKSTLLRTLSGMQPALEGRILLQGRDTRQMSARDLARAISVVLTDRVDAGMLSAYDLASLGRYPYTGWIGQLSEQDRAVVWNALEEVGAAHLAERSVGELSDGERQKVMIARALAQEPLVILLDEPTAFLDLPHRVDVMRMLRSLARKTGTAILLSTHDLDLALRSADRVWLMSADGSIQSGAPEDLILNGAFQSTFQREGVEFDTYTGSFTIEQQAAGIIHLAGEGVPALWTVRALEREGFCVERNGGSAPIRVEIVAWNSHLRWRCRLPDQTVEHDTIHDLISSLRQQELPKAN